uniref:DUF4283 domain-containing protein n=1 Tax=Tanacetum cinerariifolium TaxID=118510 RepID=A0A6L2NFS0_TANCI|nr:hypothetical protein [Tanacetum cinerariifolium]
MALYSLSINNWPALKLLREHVGESAVGSSVDGSYLSSLLFKKHPDINQEESQWTEFKEFCTLTKRSSPGNIKVVSPRVMKAKSWRGRPRKSLKEVKPKGSTRNSSSAGAGSMLMQLRLSKQASKACKRNGSSPIDNRCGKHSVKSPVNDEISKVLSDLKCGSINSHFKFDIGTSCEKSASVSTMYVAKGDCYVNHESFINSPFDKCPIENQNGPVAKNSGLGIGSEHTNMKDVGNVRCEQNNSLDGITRAKIGFVEGLAGPSIRNEHTSMEDVVNPSVVPSNGLDGIARNKDGCGFEFGTNNNARGILKKPIGPLFSVQFGRIVEANPFSKKTTWSKDKRWVSGKSSGIGSYVDRFAEKLKQGSEKLALKMEYSPNSVSKQENDNRRIEFSVKELYKGGQACSLQLYGHFVDITKTSFGIFYFKFKSEEGMKSVLDCGLWMVQNVPLVLNIWDPGIWLDKSEPSSIPIWVSVFNISMELCNGNRIGKIMSGVGKPLVMDKTTKERCLRKAGNLDYARFLVEVKAVEELPSVLKISYPATGSRPDKIRRGTCFYKTGFNNNGRDTSVKDERNPNVDKDGFTTVQRKNRLAVLVTKSDNGSGVQNKSFNNVKQSFTQKKFVAKQATNTIVNGRGNNQNQRNVDSVFKSQGKAKINNEGLKNLSKDPNFKPKVLIRGSSSNNSSLSTVKEVIPVRNSFKMLNEDGMEQGNDDGENGIYPSKSVRMGWTLHQMDYFYCNCQKLHLDPSYEDDEVESETEGIARDMKPKFESCAAMSNGNGAAPQKIKDIAMTGFRYTWNKQPGKGRGLLKKLDRVMSNVSFLSAFPNAYAQFLPFMTSNHSPAVFVIPEVEKAKQKPFKLGFIPVVSKTWKYDIKGYFMYYVVSRLKLLKKPLRKINMEQGNLFKNVRNLKSELARIQTAMVEDPCSSNLKEAELNFLKPYRADFIDDKSFLRQKSKFVWLKEGDINSKYLRNVIRGRLNKGRISMVENMNGIQYVGNEVNNQFVSYFYNVLGKCSGVEHINELDSLFTNVLSQSDAIHMVRDVSDKEVKKALFDINSNKAPGPDGFSSKFFKASWDVVGAD